MYFTLVTVRLALVVLASVTVGLSQFHAQSKTASPTGTQAPSPLCTVNRTLLLILPNDSSAPAIAAFSQIAAAKTTSVGLNLIYVTSGATPMGTFGAVLEAFQGANISGIIGPPDSSEAVVIAAWAAAVGVPVVSYSATAPSLGNTAAYPSFLRVVADDGATLDAAIALLLRSGVSRAAFLAQDDDFGIQGMSTFASAAAAGDVAVLFSGTFAHDNCSSAIVPLEEAIASGARYFLLWAFPACTDTVLLAAASLGVVGPAYVWVLASETTLSVVPASSRQFDGTIVVEAADFSLALGEDPTLQVAVRNAFAAGYPSLSILPITVYAPYVADAVFIFADALTALPVTWSGGLQQSGPFDRVMDAVTFGALMTQVCVREIAGLVSIVIPVGSMRLAS